MTEIVSLRPSRLLDSDDIFTFSNGVRMEKISRSVRQGKQAKFLDADCTCPYSPYGDVAGSYHLYDDMAHSHWLMFVELVDDTCHWWSMMRGHVAQSIGAMCHSLIG
jgi:hypothetical protein